jgi:hypothetical protein
MAWRHLLRLCALLGVFVAASLAGCGGSEPSTAEIAAERTRLTKVLAAEVLQREQTASRARESACRSQMQRALALLDAQPQQWSSKDPSLVSVGTYRERVEAIATEMSRIPRGALDRRCLDVHRALGAAETYHNGVAQDWSECIVEYGVYCDLIIDQCAGNRRTENECSSAVVDYTDTFELRLSIMRLTAEIMRSDWSLANKRISRAKEVLDSMGTAPRANPKPPRAQRAVAGSVYGRTVALMCAGDNVPSDAVEPCSALRDLLIQGVAEAEEADLNEALSDLVDAYELEPDRES